jgi:hypothetical protein
MCSFLTEARMYSYNASDKNHILGEVNTQAGWDYAVQVWVNLEVNIWRIDDVLRIEGRSETAFRTFLANGNWMISTEPQKAAALASGPLIILRELVDTGDGCPENTAVAIPCGMDPLLIDLGQDGIHLGDAGTGIYFDFNGDNIFAPVQWVAANGNEAFLIADYNQNSIVDDGSELFGRGRLLLENDRLATNGFEELGQYDQYIQGGNNDGLITDEDDIWPLLSLWFDNNADGASTPDEMISLNYFGITQFDLTPKYNGRKDPAGNSLPYWSWATNENKAGHGKYKIVDAYFRSLGPPYNVNQ